MQEFSWQLYNNLKLETTQISAELMDNQIMVYLYIGILVGNLKNELLIIQEG